MSEPIPWIYPGLAGRVAELSREAELSASLADARLSIAHLEEVLGERDDLISRIEAASGCPAEVLISRLDLAKGRYRLPA